MTWRLHANYRNLATVTALILAVGTIPAKAVIVGLEDLGSNPTFHFTAKSGYISGADGLSIHIWGYADNGGTVQYPGPTLIVQQGATVTINLRNELPAPVSIVFPGQEGVAVSTNGLPGMLTREVPADNGATVVSYSFTAARAGTYTYHSGTRPDLQAEMGLMGVIIVRPTGFDPANPRAYEHPDSAYDHEYLFLMSEMDLRIHQLVEFASQPHGQGLWDQIDTTSFRPVYWFFNGRNLPDTLLPDNVFWLPTQPYSCLPRMHPGEKLLKRIVGGGRHFHPHHPHGNSVKVIAKDGRLLESASGLGADLSHMIFTINSAPGETVDAIFEWTGKKLGWDIYGHDLADDIACTSDADCPGVMVCDAGGLDVCLEPYEYAPDHGKPFPVTLPNQLDLTFGIGYGGSPFLGQLGDLPPGNGGFNVFGGFFYPWHCHHEKEVVNNDIFPGGMFTFVIIEHHSVPIP